MKIMPGLGVLILKQNILAVKFEENFEFALITDKNIILEKGISKNRALHENIFSLFATILAKVPIFIVGKPGCSKSLSVQLIIRTMLGKSSNNLLFKSLPKLIVNSYQGSMGSTSKGVKNVFNKARDILINLKSLLITEIYYLIIILT